MKPNTLKPAALIFFTLFCYSLAAQKINVVTTAVPFLRIAPDARAAGMGDLAIGTSPDVNSIYWNAGKIAFNENTGGVSFSYTPWLNDIVKEVYLVALAGFYRWDDQQVIPGSLRYI